MKRFIIAIVVVVIAGVIFHLYSSYTKDKNIIRSQQIMRFQKFTSKTAEQNLKVANEFLSKNIQQENVITLPNGLQYKIIKQGNGIKPDIKSTVTVNYEGKLLSGEVFDSSFARGKPASFPLSNVIVGWQQAIQLMPIGSTWELFIPPNLAYGERGAPPVIGPNQLLIFKVQLLDVK